MKITNLRKTWYPVLIICLFFAGVSVLQAEAQTRNSPLRTPADPSQETTLAQRLAQRESAHRAQLAGFPRQRVIQNCKVAQSGLATLKTRDSTAADKRREIYTKLATDLNNMIDNLNRQSVDASRLSAAQKSFNDAINLYLEDFQKYKTALGDLVTINCASDPEGFYASLLEARQLRAKLARDVAAIKATVPRLVEALRDIREVLIRSASTHEQGDDHE